jgi:TupA-like ATPgrasp
MYYFHQFPNIRNPVTFYEKLNWRILKDRRPILEWTCDKLAMKEYVEKSQPAKSLGVRVPRTLWSGTDVRDLASVELPTDWVLKPNHRSGQVYFGHGQPDMPILEKISQSWFYPFEAKDLHEWAYRKARPMLLAEELLGTPGSPPSDYKFYVFAGEVAAIQVDADRHTAHRRRVYLPDWTPIEDSSGKLLPLAAQPAPATLDKMIAISSELGRPFDFIRVDLYSVDGNIFFGELTPYSGSGLEVLMPDFLNVDLGAKWKLPELS